MFYIICIFQVIPLGNSSLSYQPFALKNKIKKILGIHKSTGIAIFEYAPKGIPYLFAEMLFLQSFLTSSGIKLQSDS
jgi:hypothetical protein